MQIKKIHNFVSLLVWTLNGLSKNNRYSKQFKQWQKGNIHPSIHPIPASTWTSRLTEISWSLPQLLYCGGRVTPRTTIHFHNHTHPHLYRQFKISYSAHGDVVGLREQGGEPGENPHRHREDMQTPHIKVWGRELNWQPSCCEAVASKSQKWLKIFILHYCLLLFFFFFFQSTFPIMAKCESSATDYYTVNWRE